jgi:hypothetical protein
LSVSADELSEMLERQNKINRAECGQSRLKKPDHQSTGDGKANSELTKE